MFLYLLMCGVIHKTCQYIDDYRRIYKYIYWCAIDVTNVRKNALIKNFLYLK